MEAIILAGGQGSRLRPVVADRPKSLAVVAGRPFLAIVLEMLERAGFGAAILAVGYRWTMIRDAFGDRFGALALRYSIEDEPLGTGGALRRAVGLATEDPVFVLNGDTFAEVGFEAMAAAHHEAGVDMSMAIATLPDAARYGRLAVVQGRVAGFEPASSAGPGTINAGVYLIARRLLDDPSLPRRFSFERDFLAARVATLRPLAVPLTGRFIDIGVAEDFHRAQTLLAG